MSYGKEKSFNFSHIGKNDCRVFSDLAKYDVLVFCSPKIGWRRYQLVPDSLQKFLLVGINQRMSEQRHEVICHDNEIPTCLCCPEVICDKNHRWRNHSSVPLSYFQNPPFRDMIHYNLGWQVKVCYKAAVSVFSDFFLILKKLQLLNLLSCSFWVLIYFLPDNHNASGLLTTVCLIYYSYYSYY